MQLTVNKVGGVDKIIAANHRAKGDYEATFQNLTGSSLNISFTAQNIQKIPAGSLVYFDVQAVADGASLIVDAPFAGALLNGAGTGTVEFMEAT